jgi:hypothetical protein
MNDIVIIGDQNLYGFGISGPKPKCASYWYTSGTTSLAEYLKFGMATKNSVRRRA